MPHLYFILSFNRQVFSNNISLNRHQQVSTLSERDLLPSVSIIISATASSKHSYQNAVRQFLSIITGTWVCKVNSDSSQHLVTHAPAQRVSLNAGCLLFPNFAHENYKKCCSSGYKGTSSLTIYVSKELSLGNTSRAGGRGQLFVLNRVVIKSRYFHHLTNNGFFVATNNFFGVV